MHGRLNDTRPGASHNSLKKRIGIHYFLIYSPHSLRSGQIGKAPDSGSGNLQVRVLPPQQNKKRANFRFSLFFCPKFGLTRLLSRRCQSSHDPLANAHSFRRMQRHRNLFSSRIKKRGRTFVLPLLIRDRLTGNLFCCWCCRCFCCRCCCWCLCCWCCRCCWCFCCWCCCRCFYRSFYRSFSFFCAAYERN